MAQERASNITPQPRVLLAEDDLELRSMLVESLRGWGAEVVECSHGVELVDKLERIFGPAGQDEIDVLVSDIRMPGFTGLEVLEGLNVFGRKCPVVLITAFGDEETHAQARRLGATVLDKPFEIGDLIEAVDRAVRLVRKWNRLVPDR